MSLELAQLLPRVRVPQANHVVAVSRSECFAIRREGETPKRAVLAVDPPEFLSRGHVPKDDPFIRDGRQGLAVRKEPRRAGSRAIPWKDVKYLAGSYLEQADRIPGAATPHAHG